MHASADAEGSTLDFERDILSHIVNSCLTVLMEATGLSRRYCWLIKTGQKVPYRRHWATLLSVIRGQRDSQLTTP
jgi:hypothetical protein